MERTFERYENELTDLSFAAVRRWKQEHQGHAAAFFPVYGPVEIVHAAGMLPVLLAGAGDRLDIQHADARFGSFICSIVKTTMEMGMAGYLEPFDAFLFSGICDSARNLCFVMKRNFPQLYFDFLHLPHNPESAGTPEFLAAEYARVIEKLERISGVKVTDAALNRSIALYNRNRQLLRELYDLRRREPHRIGAREFYSLVRAGNVIPVEEHTAMLEQVLAALPARERKQRDSVRVVIEGSFCEQPPFELIQMMEDAGCYIVGDDFGLARNWFREDVPVNGNPLLALAEAYVNRSEYSSVRHDFRHPRWDGLAEKVREAKADAVIFLIAKFCEPAYFDYVLYKKKLEEIGVPHLLMEFEEKLFTFDRARTEVETFVESLLFD
jgi:benzoyl-CoA reductase subunit C